MTYRDDLDAARARAEAAERDRERAREEARVAERRAEALERRLHAARDEGEPLGAGGASTVHERTLASRRRPFLVAGLLAAIVVLLVLATRLYDPVLEFLIDDIWGR